MAAGSAPRDSRFAVTAPPSALETLIRKTTLRKMTIHKTATEKSRSAGTMSATQPVKIDTHVSKTAGNFGEVTITSCCVGAPDPIPWWPSMSVSATTYTTTPTGMAMVSLILSISPAMVVTPMDTPGEYTMRLRGNIPRIMVGRVDGQVDTVIADKALAIEQWGAVRWESMALMFQNCRNLNITATDAPDLGRVTDMSNMFQSAGSMNGSIGHWDTSNIENMGFMFDGATVFNADISTWDTSSVTSMRFMFRNANAFAGKIAQWDFSQVTDVERILAIDDGGLSTTITTTDYDALLESLAAQSVLPDREFEADAFWCEASSARSLLVNNRGWSINDYGQDPSCVN